MEGIQWRLSFIISRVSPWGELNQSHPFQAQEDFSAGHVFEVSVGLVPVPLAAQLLGDELSAALPVGLN
jgi:hypothetical protein